MLFMILYKHSYFLIQLSSSKHVFEHDFVPRIRPILKEVEKLHINSACSTRPWVVKW